MPSFAESVAVITIVAILLVCAALPFLSAVHRRKTSEFLKRPIQVDEQYKTRAAKLFGVDGAVAATVTLYDVLYHTLKLEPAALRGMVHLHRAQQFRNLGDLMSFMKEEIIDSATGSADWRQMIHKYKGYTGEEELFERWEHQGVDHSTPESGTNPDFDAVVMGGKVDVAVTDHPGYVAAKLREHPDIPVWTNREMSESFTNDPRVTVDDGLSSQDAFDATNATFEGIDGLGGLISDIPLITLAVSGSRNIYRVYAGRKDLSTAVEHTALDTAAVGAGGAIGGKVGLALGLMLAPVTGGAAAVVVPAITGVLGGIAGVVAGKGITGWYKERHLRRSLEAVQSAASQFADLFYKRLPLVRSGIRRWFNAKREHAAGMRHRVQAWWQRLLFPTPLGMFYSEACGQLASECNANLAFYDELESTMRRQKRAEAGLLLFAQGREVLSNDAQLIAQHGVVGAALGAVETEKRKLR